MEPQPDDNFNVNRVEQTPHPLRPPVPLTPAVSPASSASSVSSVPSEPSAEVPSEPSVEVPSEPSVEVPSEPSVEESSVSVQETQAEQVAQDVQAEQSEQGVQAGQSGQEAQTKTPSSDKKRTIGVICATLGVGLIATLIVIFVPWKDLLGGGLSGLGGDVTGGGNNELNNVDDVPDLSIFVGEGFELIFTEPWEKTDLDEVGEALIYNEDNYLIPTGSSALSEITSSFVTGGDRDEVYEALYDSWEDTYNLYSGQGFKLLKDDIYYARMDYMIDDVESGSIFLVASEPDDMIFSFMTNAGGSVDEVASMALKVLRSIKITSGLDDEL